ncbi:Peroxisomal membrane associated protein 20 [Fulvia fulva]|uniref:Peroxisomal membrane associated protein 20 n=1 Tax=Passalora fulva TaxID=5499 RepID=A0A9Q8URV5_PASFU|nr:Peroxisomal membrane associated protein 20 [Fulvia fulva]KAK4619955.1 Peroxisomal membrane associated protein 20 [Fulvia fulva]KAK4620666.1 Peroxisomal membrane associated protein 20 [Fulvia fulva]UJO20111.1 Peroxisomal membrane associated protein 20 [Fulvia fulva]WPV17688.1 Peroxisomal membrane associated protein 20 [Fulvia fulva]WPV32395.1 Peroxisomal membrane associated protein 20 [Fulvia fulva]
MSALVDKLKGKAKTLSKGDKIPSSAALKEDNPEKGTVDLSSLPGTNIIVGVPGAFTPPCSSQVPGYVQQADQFAAKGVKGIYIVAVNDAFTTQAWKEKLNANHPLVHFLADDTGAFSKAAGLDFDASGLLGNHRSQRYAAIVENGAVKDIFVEDEAPGVTVTEAAKVLQHV